MRLLHRDGLGLDAGEGEVLPREGGLLHRPDGANRFDGLAGARALGVEGHPEGVEFGAQVGCYRNTWDNIRDVTLRMEAGRWQSIWFDGFRAWEREVEAAACRAIPIALVENRRAARDAATHIEAPTARILAVAQRREGNGDLSAPSQLVDLDLQ